MNNMQTVENASSRLFVGNMRLEMTESELRALFEPFGEVKRVLLLADPDTGVSRGFAFVEMASEAEAAQAITVLNGKELHGRYLRVRPD